jgi:glycosyltransferase involved in cell wall biosynthesis
MPLKLAVFTRYDELGASSRTRFYAYEHRFAEAGIACSYFPFLDHDYLSSLYSQRKTARSYLPRRLMTRSADLSRLGQFDAAWVESEFFPYVPALVERALGTTRIPIVADYDDATFHKYDLNPSRMVRTLVGRKIDIVMRRATAVTAGNTYLAAHARAAGARQILCVPTPVALPAPASAPTVERAPAAPIRIGWIGTPITAPYLGLVRDALLHVASARRVEIVVIGSATSPLQGLPVSYLDWSVASEPAAIASLDIGIMPLDDTPWSRGKCAYKLLQYMAAAKPVVASPVGMNRDVVAEGTTGFLPHSTQAWAEALIRLVDDAGLRARMGAEGRRVVAERFTYDIVAPRLIDLFKSLR